MKERKSTWPRQEGSCLEASQGRGSGTGYGEALLKQAKICPSQPSPYSHQITFQENTWLEFHLLGVPNGTTSTQKGAVYGLHHPLVRENISSSINGGGEQVSIRTGQTEAMIKCSQWCLTVLVAHLHRSFLFSKAKFTNLGRSVYSQEGEAGD